MAGLAGLGLKRSVCYGMREWGGMERRRLEVVGAGLVPRPGGVEECGEVGGDGWLERQWRRGVNAWLSDWECCSVLVVERVPAMARAAPARLTPNLPP
jgi:hypothetical protein